VLKRHTVDVELECVLKLYARFEAEQEAGPYQPYRDVLRNVTAELASELGFAPTEADLNALCDSITNWPPFPDTVEALARLKRHYRFVLHRIGVPARRDLKCG
jgi:2-haloacid dehalogenase